MRLVKYVTAGWVGGWLLLTFGPAAVAQDEPEGPAVGASSARTQWEQKILRRGRPSSPERSNGEFRPMWTPPKSPRRQTPARTVSTRLQLDEAVIQEPGDTTDLGPLPPDVAYDSFEPEVVEPGMLADGCGACGGYGDCDVCGSCGPGAQCGGCGDGWAGSPAYGWGPPEPGATWWARNLSLFAGVQGFTGPADLGVNGNFGFHEGLNWGGALGWPWTVGYQIGCQATQSDFSGTAFNSGGRDQVFLTAGIFSRAPRGGLQWGVTFDLLHDEFFDGAFDYRQIRTELSLVRAGSNEIGFWGAFGAGSNHPTREPTGLYAFFYRQYLQRGGEARIWSGFTGKGDALVGGDIRIPVSTSWALENSANYLSPKQDWAAGGAQEESWGVTAHLVWYPGQRAAVVRNNPFYPLFGVADNSVFMLDNN